jgi:hypothetical protein
MLKGRSIAKGGETNGIRSEVERTSGTTAAIRWNLLRESMFAASSIFLHGEGVNSERIVPRKRERKNDGGEVRMKR